MSHFEPVIGNLTAALFLGIFFLLAFLLANGGIGFTPKEAPDVCRHFECPRIFVKGSLEGSTIFPQKIRKLSLWREELR